MEKLISGVHRFRKQYWSENKDLFRRLAEHGQFPEALFITCCDSRVIPTVITHSHPGDLFILRNIGNFVPPYSESPLDGTGAAASIEYAVEHLKVRDIIVCGHSDCGAMKALYKDRSTFAGTPHIGEWLRNGERTLEVVAPTIPNCPRKSSLR
jgi:carbonic anhydrase